MPDPCGERAAKGKDFAPWWVCPPCRHGSCADTFHLLGADVGPEPICACEVCRGK